MSVQQPINLFTTDQPVVLQGISTYLDAQGNTQTDQNATGDWEESSGGAVLALSNITNDAGVSTVSVAPVGAGQATVQGFGTDSDGNRTPLSSPVTFVVAERAATDATEFVVSVLSNPNAQGASSAGSAPTPAPTPAGNGGTPAPTPAGNGATPAPANGGPATAPVGNEVNATNAEPAQAPGTTPALAVMGTNPDPSAQPFTPVPADAPAATAGSQSDTTIPGQVQGGTPVSGQPLGAQSVDPNQQGTVETVQPGQ